MVIVFLFILAAVLFLLVGLGVPEYPRFRYIGWGLFFMVIAFLLQNAGRLSVR